MTNPKNVVYYNHKQLSSCSIVDNERGDLMPQTASPSPPHCDTNETHPDALTYVQEALPPDTELARLAALYKVFADPTRIKILYALFHAELCVCDLAVLLGVTVSAVSHQLRVLKQAELVKYRREGKIVYYSLADDHVRTIIDQGNEHIHE